MSKKLINKVAVVTGASKGIGAAIAKDLANEGASVVVNYASSALEAEKVVAAIIANGGKALAIQADVSKLADIERLFSVANESFGAIDILVNNAGVYNPGSLEDIDDAHFYKHFDLNVRGLMLTTKEAVKYFNSTGGSIVNISSFVSTYGMADLSMYSATKGAVDSFTYSLSKELGPRNIRVNNVNPGMVETEGLHATGFIEEEDNVKGITPLGRIGQPEDIANAVTFFASEDSSWITGETLNVSGGLN